MQNTYLYKFVSFQTVDGPFDYERDPIGTIITYVGCNPGKNLAIFA
jgi:hypothetical protein